MEELHLLILREMYGDQTAHVASFFLKHGDLSLSKLAVYSEYPVTTVRNVLTALIQQNLVQVSNTESPTYRVLTEEIVARLRFPKYIEAMEKGMGLGEVTEAVLLNGSLNIAEMQQICPNCDLTQVQKAIKSNFFTVLPTFSDLPISEQPLKRESTGKIQQLLKEKRLESTKTPKKNRKTQQIPATEAQILDETVNYRVNFRLLDRKLLFNLLKGLFEGQISPKSMRILDYFSQFGTNQSVFIADLSTFTGFSEGDIQNSLKNELFSVVIQCSPNTYRLEITEKVEFLQQQMVEKLICQHLGDYSARVFQILRAKGFMDERNLSNLTLLPPITTQTALNDLFRLGLVGVQEVPPERNLFYGVRFGQIKANLMRNVLQGIFNLKVRLREESLSAHSLYQSGREHRFLDLETRLESAILELDRTYMVLSWSP